MFEYDFERTTGSMIIPSKSELQEVGMSRVKFIFSYILDINKNLEKNNKKIVAAI